MFVKMLTRVHMLVYTLWCWHTLRRRWSLKCRERMGSAGFGAFQENEVHIFYCADGSFGEVARVFLAEKHSSDASC